MMVNDLRSFPVHPCPARQKVSRLVAWDVRPVGQQPATQPTIFNQPTNERTIMVNWLVVLGPLTAAGGGVVKGSWRALVVLRIFYFPHFCGMVGWLIFEMGYGHQPVLQWFTTKYHQKVRPGRWLEWNKNQNLQGCFSWSPCTNLIMLLPSWMGVGSVDELPIEE